MSEPTPAAVPTEPAAASTTAIDLTHVDYTALTRPITSTEVRAFRAQVRAQQRANPSIRSGLATAMSVVVIVFVVGFVGMFIALFIAMFAEANGTDLAGGGIGGLVFVVIVLALTAVIVARRFGAGGTWAKLMRLTQFAAANHLEFRTRSNQPGYPGMIFQIGDTRYAFDHLNSTSGRYFDLGSYSYSTGSGKNRSTSYWGFMALRLDRKLPNMVLDSRANNTFLGSDLPVHFSRDQILSLEGDFDKHFTLYCPKEYETDALYVFTPDLMALLIDDAGAFDIEIVDDWMFVYTPHRLPALEPGVYQRLFSIAQTVGNKTITQTDNYHDDRVASATANIVAPAGERLRHGTSIGAMIVVFLFAAVWIFGSIYGH